MKDKTKQHIIPVITLPDAVSSLSSQLGCVHVEEDVVEASEMHETDEKGGNEQFDGHGDGGFIPRCKSRRGSLCVRLRVETGAMLALLLGLYLGISRYGTEK